MQIKNNNNKCAVYKSCMYTNIKIANFETGSLQTRFYHYWCLEGSGQQLLWWSRAGRWQLRLDKQQRKDKENGYEKGLHSITE